ncbi:X-Pro dipeptidyl-peptidase [Mycobacterium sp. CBMA 234]|uniref:CocE/NonD family hydrolase n=1 Tax=Mycolicibacterium sp. CBMA 234 TaxID=1918495 RepID=UPI001EE4DAAF|nr:CocE/NonD family hydrolase [Mycolicibacterium sp. CBMA 234]MUL67102.1 X-Pro dipeptidyl-peptidase [Mycolicibacterium sp. CBMA 234]
MTLQGRIIERVLKVSPALTRDVKVTKDLRFLAYDGVQLLANLHEPRDVPNAPTLLVRTPYARTGLVSRLISSTFAERGYNVLVTAARGTDGSGGVLEPFRNETDDGLATLDWIEKQPWHNGKIVMFGPSYLGFVQYAAAVEAGDRIDALFPMIGSSDIGSDLLGGDTVSLAGVAAWTARMVTSERHTPLLADFKEIVGDKRARKAMEHLPLREIDIVGTGCRVPYFQQWLDNSDPAMPYWKSERSCADRVGDIVAPTLHFTGWQDILLPTQLADYASMRAAGRDPYLTVGPWTHVDFSQFDHAVTEALTWFEAHTTGDHSKLRELPVRLYIFGADEWRDYPEYPPPGVGDHVFNLWPGGGLGGEPAAPGAVDRFTYRPSDPTPDVGGPLLDPRTAGSKDQKSRESRADVAVYTGKTLCQPLEVIGPVSAQIRLRTSSEHADVFVRLCDVDEDGVSTNVCDGIQRITTGAFPVDEEGARLVTVQCWPTAYRFKPRHQLRVQVSGGSFPRFARNLGTDDPLGTATRMVDVDYEILPGSTVTLSMLPSASAH